MKMFLKLIKTNLNVTFGLSTLKYRFTKEKKKLWEPILTLIGVFLGIGSMFLLFTLFMLGTYIKLKEQGQPETILAIAFLGSSFFLLFFGVFHIISAFYFSKDLEFLISLPLKPYQIIGSKFITIMFNEYVIALPMVIPAIAIYGIGMNMNILYWLKAFLSILIMPIIPLVLSAIIVIVLMRFINIKKGKDVIIVIMSFVSLLVGLGANFYIQKLLRGNGSEIEDVAQIPVWLIDMIGRRFPPALWATYGITKESLAGLGYFLLFVCLSILMFMFMLWMGNKFFYKGFYSGQGEGSKKKKLTNSKRRHFKNSSVLVSLFKREWKLMFRSPVFMMNGFAGIIIMPVMFVMTILTQSEGSMGRLIEMTQEPSVGIYVSIGGLAVMVLTSSMNIVSSTALSREGQSFWISKIIPVSPAYQIMAKFMHGLAVSCIGILIIGVLMVAFLNVSILKLPVLFLLALINCAIIIIINLIIDLVHPKLNWTNPHEAVKTNLNGLFGLIVSMCFLGAMGFFFITMIVFFKSDEWLIYTTLFIIDVAVLVPGIFILLKISKERYKNIEI
ncbi:hypothetical protein RBH29_03380 [Herbivorax sp. ANBcel31]|uniref:putative ABC transporter permease subunit n=1 Tax=Herbivorax sp. ANBcel31 TaxID=3069754 RepID=UPI0027AF0924|nr:hypothetical protein [Herbivorax sp. ANBcel31]MDQ2085473.1 hypothetical protein [Herbivorax sp. ANBcel31]